MINRLPIEVMRNQVRKYADGGTVTKAQDFDRIADEYANLAGHENETPEERAKRGEEMFPKLAQDIDAQTNAKVQDFDRIADEYAKLSGHENETPEERARRGEQMFPKFIQMLDETQKKASPSTDENKWNANIQNIRTEAIAGAEKKVEIAQQNVSAAMLDAAHLKTEAANEALANATLLADQANKKLDDLKRAKTERVANQDAQPEPAAYTIDDPVSHEFDGDPAAKAEHEKFLAGQAEDERLSAIRQAADAKMMDGLNARSEASMKRAAEYAESLRGGEQPTPSLGQVENVAPVIPPSQDMIPPKAINEQSASLVMPPNREMQPPQAMPVENALPVAPQAANLPSQTAAPQTGMQRIMAEYSKKKADIEAQQQRILDSIESRIDRPSDKLFALARGFGAPSQTGSFHEALGRALGTYSDQQVKTVDQLREVAKMRMELAKGQMGRVKEDVGMGMIGSLSGNDQNMAVGAGQSVAGAGNSVAQQNSGWLSKVTPEFLAQYSIIDPDGAKALEAAIKVDIESQKMGPQGGVYNARTGKWSTNFQPGQAQVPVYVPGRGTFSWRPEETHYYYAEREKGPEAEKAAFEYITRGPGSSLAKPTGGVASSVLPQLASPPVPSGEATPPLSQEDLKVLATRRAAEATKQGTTDAVTRDAIRKSDNTSYGLTNSADAIIKIAQEHPAVIGVLAKPGIGTAILSAIEEGVKIGYHGNVGIPALSDVVRKISGSTQADIDAAAAITRYGREIELGYRTTFLKGQGSVSNMEGEKIVDIVPNIKDPAKVLLMKAEHIKNIAQFDRDNAKALARWDDKHPSGSMAQYEQSKEYLAAREKVGAATDALREKYFPSKKAIKPVGGDKLNDLIKEFEGTKK